MHAPDTQVVNGTKGKGLRGVELETNFDFGPTKEVGVHRSAEEAETGHRRTHRNGKPKTEPTKKGGVKTGKTETWMWSDVVKGLKIGDELETTNLHKSGNESKTTDSVEMFDLEEPNYLQAKGQGSRQVDREGRDARNRMHRGKTKRTK